MSNYTFTGKLVEVRVREDAVGGLFAHGDRFVNCWLHETDNPKVVGVQMVGAEGIFDFVEGRCADFLGKYKAVVMGEINPGRLMEADRIVDLDELRKG